MSRIQAFFRRHPAVRDALVWALPAIAFGFVLRALLTAYQPYAYWGPDSSSYYSFSYRLMDEGVASIPAKRRFLFPILMLPVSLLPGSMLRWLAFFQPLMGLLTIIPLAYVVRKIFVGWKWWVIPATVIYAGMPIIVWYERELISEAFFFATVVWMFAAWTAWCGRIERADRAVIVWWIFLACLAACVFTKPAARFFWPGLVVGLVYMRAWRHLRWPQWAGLAAIFVVMISIGERNQASRLLYSSIFPLTVLDSPLHADLKAEIAPMVRASRARLDYFYLEDSGPKNFLRGEYREGGYPAWAALDKKNGMAVGNAMRDMALEAMRSAPHLFVYIALQRAVGSMNWTRFKLEHFEPDYYAKKLEPAYTKQLAREEKRELGMVTMALGIKTPNGAPPFSVLREKIEPKGHETAAAWVTGYVQAVTPWGRFVAEPNEDGIERRLWELTPTFAGWWLIAGCLVAMVIPGFRGTLGVWVVTVTGYVVGVYLIGSENTRFFAAAWPPLIVALFAPFDGIYRLVSHRFSLK